MTPCAPASARPPHSARGLPGPTQRRRAASRATPTAWKAEQAIRPAVVNRKAAGAQAQGVLMSVFKTCRRQALSVVDHVSRTLRWFGNRLLPRPVLLLGR